MTPPKASPATGKSSITSGCLGAISQHQPSPGSRAPDSGCQGEGGAQRVVQGQGGETTKTAKQQVKHEIATASVITMGKHY